ncbi:MAG: YggS family pyridoxal phosphate-dependent enzyme [Spirochaetes bacterium]|nr:MAG: YggS family pyridoxal phosphate-dependent enzyme [Spirochaetota bacterium]
MVNIKENLERIHEKIEKALERSGRKDSVTLVAVTKTVEPERIIQAIECGVSIIGENRVQEALEKFKIIGNRAEWHMVGHLQRNKVKDAVKIFKMIQSIDKVETAAEIQKRTDNPIDILIEINSSGEETKYGIDPGDASKLVEEIIQMNKLRIRGIMTIGPLTDDEKLIRKAFSLTRETFEKLKNSYPELNLEILSMGMSGDYEIAIEEGSNMVRIGTAIFGERRY